MIERAAHLPANIKQVPDREAFLASQHGGYAIALDVFHGGAELAVDYACAVNDREIGIAQDFRGFRFLQEAFLQIGRSSAEGRQPDRFEGDGLGGRGIVGFVHRARSGFYQLTQNFKVTDFVGHFCTVPLSQKKPRSFRQRNGETETGAVTVG